MSVVARVQVTKKDFTRIVLYNDLIEAGYKAPKSLKSDILPFLDTYRSDKLIQIFYDSDNDDNKIVELPIGSHGPPGLTVNLSNLPANAISVCFYTEDSNR